MVTSNDDVHGIKTFKLCVDGKNINMGVKDQKMGDVNLWGYEGPPSLSFEKEKLKEDLELLEAIQNSLYRLEMRNIQHIKDMPDSLAKNFIENVLKLVHSLSMEIKELRLAKVKKQTTLEKLKRICTTNEMRNQYNCAIRSIKTYLYQIEICIDHVLTSIDKMIHTVTELRQSDRYFSNSEVCDLSSQANYFSLTGIETTIYIQGNVYRYKLLKQRSEQWHQARSFAKVTGSTLHAALGFNGLEFQQKHFDMVCRPIKPPELSETVKQRMQNGRENEIHAIATLASKFLPAFYPDLGYVEEGCYMESYQNEPFVVVSPDGSCRNIFDQKSFFRP